jgi:phosphate transport system substrate-binding protein
MVHKKYSSAVGFALLLTTTVAEVQLVRAQQYPTFQLPASVKEGTNVRIDGSTSMAAVNDVLKKGFEQKFQGTKVEVAANGVPEGIKAVVEGKADLAAIGRPLNEQEKAQGLTAVPVGRDKIAILVGADNPFAKSITITQFAKMFRGEIKNWSEVGGPSAPVKFVDRPDSSDTREAFKSYPVFKQGNFATGATAEKLNEDTTKAVVSKLGNTGIGYITANQTKGLTGAKAVSLDSVAPTDSRYPFSQALYYVYKGEPNDAVKAFLGFATAPVGQKALTQAGVADAIAVNAATPAVGKKVDAKTDAKAPNKAGAADKKAPVAIDKNTTGTAATTSASPNGNNAQDGTAQTGDSNPLAFLFPGSDTAGSNGAGANTGGLPNWLWWLLPIASGATLLWMLGRSRRGTGDAGDAGATGSFNAPGYAAGDSPDRDDRFSAPYVEGGFDPLQNDRNDSAAVDAPEFGFGRETDVNVDPNFIGDRARTDRDDFGNLGSFGGAAVAGGAAAAAWSTFSNRGQQSRVVLKARSPQEVEAFWDIPSEERQAMRQQGGEKLALRLYDVTDIDLENQSAHSVQQFDCDELTQRQRLPIALPDRDYLAEIGYLTSESQWLGLARSTHVRVPATSGSNFLGNVAKAGGAAVAGGAAAATDAVDSAKSFLSGDRDDAPTDLTEAQTSNSPNWFQRITNRAGETTNDVTQAGANTVAGGATAAGAAAAGAGAAAWSFLSGQRKESQDASATETQQFITGETATDTNGFDSNGVNTNGFVTGETNSSTPSVGGGRLVLTPRNSRWAYASWDIPRSLRSRIDLSSGENLVLRLYDVTDAGTQLPSRYEEHDIDDMALSCDVPISQGDRTYVAEIGYVGANQEWTSLARSLPAYVPGN